MTTLVTTDTPVVRRLRDAIATVIAIGAALALAAPAAAPAAPAGAGGVAVAQSTLRFQDAAGSAREVFPVRGNYAYWDGLGAGRAHQGVDLGARCGTPLVAARAGKVRYVKFHARAGNYVVIDVKGAPIDIAYMHLRESARVRPGQQLRAGQFIGRVGETGNASGCHLHFEVWDGAYYRGGSPVDPMPFLAAWEGDRKPLARR